MQPSRYLQSVIDRLARGETVENYKEGGNSMTPRIKDGQKQTLVPIKDLSTLKKNDIVLCKVKGNYFTHLVKGKKQVDGKWMFLIGNNHGHINGWTEHVFGQSVDVYW